VDEGRFIRAKVSTGMSDEERKHFWAHPEDIVGYIIEVHADALTQNEKEVGSNNYSLRFPSFNGKRGLAPGDKI
jgi:ATP-dependent DNA ligase